MTDKSEDPRVKRTRLAFQSALFELLETRQFEDIRISDIAKKSTFSRNAFYTHFDSKEALLFSYTDDLFEQLMQSLYDDLESVEEIDLKMLIEGIFDLLRSRAEKFRYIIQVAKKDLVIERFRIHAVTFVGFYRKNKKVKSSHTAFEDYIIDVAASGWFMLFKRWMEEGMQVDSETMARLLIDSTPVELMINGR